MSNSHKSTTRADAHPPGQVTDFLDFSEQGSNPSSPAASTERVFVKSDGLYIKNSGGTVTGPFGSGGGGAPTTTPYITTAADAGLSAEVVIPGLAGSADIKGQFGGGTSREFESGDTAPTWSSAPATTDVGSTRPSHLYVKTTDSSVRLGTYSWSPAGAFDARLSRLSIGSDSASVNLLCGLHIGDSGNNNRLLCILSTDSANKRFKIQAYTYASSAYTQRGADWFPGANVVYLRITRDGSNNASFWWSSDGWAWQLVATQALTLTVANIGIYNFADSAAAPTYAFIDALRTDV